MAGGSSKNEIDEIFALGGGKGKAKAKEGKRKEGADVVETLEEKQEKKKKKKKGKGGEKLGGAITGDAKGESTRAAPETVQDPSVKALTAANGLSKSGKRKAGDTPKRLTEEEKEFRDTRGSSRRKTDDGYAVYTEAELGLNRKGAGETPLCPFDCDCCF